MPNEWMAEAKEVRTIEEFAEFYRKVVTDTAHDYNTCVYANAAVALAAARLASNHLGITGFQAGCVMWEFIADWRKQDGPMKLTTFEDMLYPQYDDRFDTVISPGTWKWLQEQASERIAADAGNDIPVHPAVFSHWQSIVDGVVPFGYRVGGDL